MPGMMSIDKTRVKTSLLQLFSSICYERKLFLKNNFISATIPTQVYPFLSRLHKWSPGPTTSGQTILNIDASVKNSILSYGFLYRNPKDYSPFSGYSSVKVEDVDIDTSKSLAVEAYALSSVLKQDPGFPIKELVIYSSNEGLIKRLNLRLCEIGNKRVRSLLEHIYGAAMNMSSFVRFNHCDRLCNKPADFLSKMGGALSSQYFKHFVPNELIYLMNSDIDRSLSITASPYGIPESNLTLFELIPNSNESKLFLQWIDVISETVANHLLKEVTFYIVSNEEVEVYNVGAKHFSKKKIKSNISFQSLAQLNRFMALLKPLSQKKTMYMEMLLCGKNTPKDYQSQCFNSGKGKILLPNQSDYLKMDVGIMGGDKFQFDISGKGRYDLSKFSKTKGVEILNSLYDGKCQNLGYEVSYPKPQSENIADIALVTKDVIILE